MIDLETIDLFRDNKESLQNISYDTSVQDTVQYMTESTRLVTSFDLVKRRYVNAFDHSENDAQSLDALMQAENDIIFIEFKNGKVNPSDVKTKVRDSLLMYCDITKSTISNTRADSVFVLVYNLDKNPPPNQITKNAPPEWRSQIFISRYFANKGNNELIRYDLERFKGLYFREVHTYTKDEFDHYLRELYT